MRGRWQGLVPGLAIGFGIVLGTLVAKRIEGIAGAAVLALAILLADALAAGERGAPRRASLGAWILAATCLVVMLIAGTRNPLGMGETVSTLGASAWLVLILPNSRPLRCFPPSS